MQKTFSERRFACWICDTWMIITGIILVACVALIYKAGCWRLPALPPGLPEATLVAINSPVRFDTPSSPLAPTPSVTAAASTDTPVPATQTVTRTAAPLITQVPESTMTATPPASTTTQAPEPTTSIATTPQVDDTPTPTITPTQGVLTYVIAFMPVNWAGTQMEFAVAARKHADFFLRESEIEDFFEVDIVALEDGLVGADITDPMLVYDVIEFGMQNFPADRYVGLTDQDVAMGDNSDVSGWTFGPDTQAIIAEDWGEVITAHELGHTYGLCDEYAYLYWTEQNEEFPGGCPNPFPSDCSQDLTSITCDGRPATDGRNSIMGPAGLWGEYTFNETSKTHLLRSWELMGEVRTE